jgi:hypothetical protein
MYDHAASIPYAEQIAIQVSSVLVLVELEETENELE